MLSYGFDHTLHRREEPPLPSLRQVLPPSTSHSSSPPLLYSISEPLDRPAPCAPSMLEPCENEEEMPKSTLSRKLVETVLPSH